MILMTSAEQAIDLVGKRVRYKQSWWRRFRHADAVRVYGGALVVRTPEDVEVSLEIRANDPWHIEAVTS